ALVPASLKTDATAFTYYLHTKVGACPMISPLPLHAALPISITLRPALSLAEAMDTMRAHDISGLPVVEGSRPVGILTSRDIRFEDRKSTRLNSSHVKISYAVSCLKKKNSKIFIRD